MVYRLLNQNGQFIIGQPQELPTRASPGLNWITQRFWAGNDAPPPAPVPAPTTDPWRSWDNPPAERLKSVNYVVDCQPSATKNVGQ